MAMTIIIVPSGILYSGERKSGGHLQLEDTMTKPNATNNRRIIIKKTIILNLFWRKPKSSSRSARKAILTFNNSAFCNVNSLFSDFSFSFPPVSALRSLSKAGLKTSPSRSSPSNGKELRHGGLSADDKIGEDIFL